MVDEYFEFGVLLEAGSEGLSVPRAISICRTIDERDDFHLREVRHIDNGNQSSDILVVECVHVGVPNKNKVGIKGREVLALRFFVDEKKQPEVRALRKGFPITPHQNHVFEGESASLCIYYEPWSSTERSWTPQKHLERIKWWLLETSKGTLHQGDQPVEQLYFQPEYEIVVPKDFGDITKQNDLVFNIKPMLMDGEKNFRVLKGTFSDKAEVLAWNCLTITLPPIIHGEIERTPSTLGVLAEQLSNRGIDFFDLLVDSIKQKIVPGGMQSSSEPSTLILLNIPMIRSEGTDAIERYDIIGYVTMSSFTDLAVSAGVMHCLEGTFYEDPHLGGVTEVYDWKSHPLSPVGILSSFSESSARKYSGLSDDGPTKGVIAGVGALGSELYQIWLRQGWGQWSLIDPDYLKPHNLARHIAVEDHIGIYKVDAVKSFENHIYPEKESAGVAIHGSANDTINKSVSIAIQESDLVVDVTTTLEVPRDLSCIDSAGRCCSVFITPSGNDSVLIIEDKSRNFRLDDLESQYYKSIISNAWGKNHLVGHNGHLWVGAGCRDISNIIPNDLVKLHAAILARQVRLKAEASEPSIQVWHSDPVTGSVKTDAVIPSKVIKLDIGDYQLIWTDDLRDKIHAFRHEKLPNETGGVLLGYFDQKSEKVFIVDVLPEPEDSHGDPTGFTRGFEGLIETISTVNQQTSGIVSYIGEWHSHPQGAGISPSAADVIQLAYLACQLNDDGYPAFMLIVGNNDENWTIGQTL